MPNSVQDRPSDDHDDLPRAFAKALADEKPTTVDDLLATFPSPSSGNDALWHFSSYVRSFRSHRHYIDRPTIWTHVVEVEYTCAIVPDADEAWRVGNHRRFKFEIEGRRAMELNVPGFSLHPDERHGLFTVKELESLREQFEILMPVAV
jgi:hypothetical protein